MICKLILIALFLALIGPGAFFWTLPNDATRVARPGGQVAVVMVTAQRKWARLCGPGPFPDRPEYQEMTIASASGLRVQFQ